MAYLEELLPEFRKGAKIRKQDWRPDHYLYYENNGVWNEDTELVSFDGVDLVSTNWEFYKDPEPDWDYIIKNKCLCAFWNKKGCEFLGFLKQRSYYKDTDFYTYTSLSGAIYTGCRPVCRDEVTFYEDREE